MPNVGSGTGRGGKSFQDRELAARVRRLTLLKCEEVLLKGKGKLYQAVLLRLAGTALPRLNAGRDDNEPLFLKGVEIKVRK